MKKKNNNIKLKDLILPNKKINFFIITIMVFGIIAGSIFLVSASSLDKSNVISSITNFFKNISDNSIDKALALKNSLIINYLFVIIIWGLGLSVMGVVVNIFLTFIRGFLVGFSVSAIFLAYGYKGILPSILYVLFGQVLNVIVVIVLSVYSIMFAKNLLDIIINRSSKLILKRYVVILVLAIFISFISSLIEVYVFPNILRLIVRYYI